MLVLNFHGFSWVACRRLNYNSRNNRSMSSLSSTATLLVLLAHSVFLHQLLPVRVNGEQQINLYDQHYDPKKVQKGEINHQKCEGDVDHQIV